MKTTGRSGLTILVSFERRVTGKASLQLQDYLLSLTSVNIEREECQRLLESALSSPSSHLSDSGPGSPVSVLSTGDNRGFRRRGSSFALAASQLLSLDQGQQLPNDTWMRNGDPMMTIQPTSTDFSSIYTSLPSTVEGHLSQQAQEIEKRTRKTRRHSTIQAANQVGDYLELDLSEDMQLGAKPSSIQMPAFLPLTRRQASAALLAEAFDRPIRQSASFQNWKMPSIEGQEEPVSSPLRARLTTQGRAAPSSLDLVRFEQVGGAMAAASSTMQSTHRRSISDSTVQISASRCERSMTISLSPPATALETHFASEQAQQQRQRGHRIAFRDPFSDVEAGEVMQEKSSVHNSSILSPWSPKVMQQWGKNVERTIRRSSSLDYRYVPSEKQCEGSESPTSNHHKSETTTGSMQQPQRRPMRGEIPSPTKATALLGMNPLNAHLLVPGGLPTGEHVYHGVDIPCAAVHLQSDDEDDEVQGLSSSNAKRGMKGWLSKKIRSGS